MKSSPEQINAQYLKGTFSPDLRYKDAEKKYIY